MMTLKYKYSKIVSMFIFCISLIISASKSEGAEFVTLVSSDRHSCTHCKISYGIQLDSLEQKNPNLNHKMFLEKTDVENVVLIDEHSLTSLLFDVYYLLLQFSRKDVFANEIVECSVQLEGSEFIASQRPRPYNFELKIFPDGSSDAKRQISSLLAEREDYVSALTIASEIENLEIRSLAFHSLALRSAERFKFDLAFYIADVIEKDLVRILTINNIAQVQIALDEKEKAVASLSYAIAESRKLENMSDILIALSELLVSLVLLQEMEAATLISCKALGMIASVGGEGHKFEALAHLSRALAFLGYFSESLNIALKIPDPWLKGKSLQYISYLYGWAGNFRAANETISYIEDPWIKILALTEISGQLVDYGDFAEARLALFHAESVMYEIELSPIMLSAFRLINDIDNKLNE
jgi:hypothetical protein